MGRKDETDKARLLKKVVAAATKRLGVRKGHTVGEFIERYYQNVPPGDLLDRTADDLFGAAHAHWRLAAKRKPRQSLVRVYNPDKKTDGWSSNHTVVEIIVPDMPFLVDSMTSEMNRQGLAVHLVIHPVIGLNRGRGGALEGLITLGTPAKRGSRTSNESFMRLEVNEQKGGRLKDIEAGVGAVLGDVNAAVEDWVKMREAITGIVDELSKAPKGTSVEDVAETREFLTWAHDEHFTFLGFREYDFVGTGTKASVSVRRKSGLGVLRDPQVVVFRELQNLASMPPEVRAFVSKGDMLNVTKTNSLSTVHRPVHMDAISIKRYDNRGRVVGQRIFVGLFTSGAYNRSPRDIPLLRLKLQKAFRKTGFAPGSHDGKALLNILETFPRDELFQISDQQFYQTAMGILHLQERQHVALFVRRDDFERFISCLIYVPRDRYTTALRLKMQNILEDAFSGEVSAHYAQLGESALGRLHIIVQTTPGKIPTYDESKIESRLIEVARSWTDGLRENLVDERGEGDGLDLYGRYADAFSAAYQDRFATAQATSDITRIDECMNTGTLSMKLYRDGGPKDKVRFKVYNPDGPIALSDVLPMLEHMGLKVLDEVPFQVTPRDSTNTDSVRLVMIHDFGLQTRDGSSVDPDATAVIFQDAFSRVWSGEVESDGFNALVLGAGLAWRDIMILRAYCKYLRQTGIQFSQDYMENTLANNPGLARNIVDLFVTTFDPKAKGRDKQQRKIRTRLNAGLAKVVSADEDRILRRYVNLVEVTLRTNFFQITDDGAPKGYMSFKLDSAKVDELPLPRPFREIFVYSPRIEGVHLRFGMVARGGLRWSDRREDFRTEILGLVKAQQVKNTVIVPVGSKGGFVLKNPPPMSDRDAFLAEGIACYKLFISGLLDITDNLDGDRVIPPKSTVRLDSDDPYLVVAADKGTATFSDIANSVSLDYGFWLGDAFASGGSVGYDHKAMGITARGGWESVKRHFREMGVNTQTQDFDVVGVGDMSGDVFGNGMLLSKHICLIGAFNHMHIFVDPNPSAKKTFPERKRMFNMPRSSWTDFNAKLISKGGGIFERSAKSIKLSPEIKERFGITKNDVTPNELIGALLRAKTDLLWFGGIGTYLKASTESHLDVGDRANDAIRINATELNCKAVGEGANLGVTQRARIEAALKGVRLYADSIDNSAGVDCSDHEVNIKILIDKVVRSGKLTQQRRNTLLASMTDEVGLQVLVDNYRQTQAINMILSQGMKVFDNQVRLMRMLEKSDRLNREVEFLPDDEKLVDRAAIRVGLTGPEVAVLMSYAKIWVFDELKDSSLPDDPALADELSVYFPAPLRKKYAKEINGHRLKREIVATLVTNSIINRVGGTFVSRMMERTGMPAADVVAAYVIARRVLGMRDVWGQIDALDNNVPAAVQTDMRLDTSRLIEWTTLWFLRNGHRPLTIGAHVDEFADGFRELNTCLGSVLPKRYQRDVISRGQPYVNAGAPKELARTIADMVNLYSGCDIVRLAAMRKLPVVDTARLYFAVGNRFRLGTLRAAAEGLEAQTHWEKLAAAALSEEIYSHQLALTSQVIDSLGRGKKATDAVAAIDAWTAANGTAVERTEQLIAELLATEITDMAMIAVASRQLRTLAEMPPSK